MWDLDEPQGGAARGRHMLDCWREEMLINEDVTHSAAATQQQHLVQRRRLGGGSEEVLTSGPAAGHVAIMSWKDI